VPSARYVDDIYVFVESVDAADQLLRELIPALRSYDLVINEAKSVIIPKSALITEEPDLEALFADAGRRKFPTRSTTTIFDADYGFQSEWDDEEIDEEDLELQATMLLFDSLSEYPGHEREISNASAYRSFPRPGPTTRSNTFWMLSRKRPSMSQIYASYLASYFPAQKIAGLSH